MNVGEYVAIAETTDRLEPRTPTGPNYKLMPILGLAGEIGSLLAELKKMVREPQRSTQVSRERLKEELGDILWYAVTIARRAGLNFQEDVLFGNLMRIKDNPGLYLPLFEDNDGQGKALCAAVETDGVHTADTFNSYQTLAAKSARLTGSREAVILYLAQIWKNSGELLGELKLLTPEFDAVEKQIVAETLGDVMWYVAGFSTLYCLNLDCIASENAKKTLSMFMPKNKRKRTPLYDKDFPLLEQFPRQFDVIFTPPPSDNEQAIMIVNGMRVGSPLRDNAYPPTKGKKQAKEKKSGTKDDRRIEIDGYRFHDSVHFAFVAILGWSPVMRGLMKRKRKTKREVDDADDGARAQIVEEMIVKLAHSYAVGIHRKNLLDDHDGVSFDLLKEIRILAEGLEVIGDRKGAKAAEYWEWEEAILEGFRVYNLLRDNRGGRLRVDMIKRKIEFFQLKDGEENTFPFVG